MKDNNGKIILSLLVGATAGAVAGLLLAPETGEGTRASLKQSVSKLGDDLGKLLGSLTNKGKANDGSKDFTQATSVLNSLYSTGTASNKANSRPSSFADHAAGIESVPGTYEDFDSDYDGSAGDGRYVGTPNL